MRITFNMMARRALDDVLMSAQRLQDAQQRVSTGKRISKPSDDVGGTGRALNLRSTISEIDQYMKNADSVKSGLEVTNSALDSVVTTLQQVRVLALQAANSTTTPEARTAMAAELDQIMSSLTALGNSQYAGKYIFAGSATNSPPFVPSGSPTPPYSYVGNNALVSVQVAPWTNASCNVTGETLFNMGSAAVPGSPDLLSTIQALKDEIEAGNVGAITARIADVDANLNNVITIRSEVGARISRIETITQSLGDSKTSLATLLSKTEDADLTEAVLDLRTRENIYQAAVATAGRIMQITLADYIK